MLKEDQAGTLQLEKITKKFGSFRAVSNVDLEIRKGEFLTLLGPSGSGRTTLLMMIAGFLDIVHFEVQRLHAAAPHVERYSRKHRSDSCRCGCGFDRNYTD